MLVDKEQGSTSGYTDATGGLTFIFNVELDDGGITFSSSEFKISNWSIFYKSMWFCSS